jgi:hypothetical protein
MGVAARASLGLGFLQGLCIGIAAVNKIVCDFVWIAVLPWFDFLRAIAINVVAVLRYRDGSGFARALFDIN